jgi:diadenylate cyclase
LEDALHYFSIFKEIGFKDAIDIALVTLLIYRVLVLVRGTRAWRITLGVLGYLLFMLAGQLFKFNTLYWLLEKGSVAGPVALVILFLPELRQAIEGFGRFGGLLQNPIGLPHRPDEIVQARTIEEMVAACAELASESVGALIVIERSIPLDDIVGNGVILNAEVSAPLLGSIFFENNPLHDGAVIIRQDKIAAAACRLPLSESSRLDPVVHMRHRAAVGVTENLDCIGIVISEERGTISVAFEGRLRRLANHLELREFLNRELRSDEKVPKPVRLRRPRVRRSQPEAKDARS